MAKITRVDQAVPTIKTKKKVAAYARISMESERMNHFGSVVRGRKKAVGVPSAAA